jgi:molybdopterin/thiamine biosynthesis adenylyltransferase
MNTSRREADAIARGSVLVVGVGGLGCPAALALVNAGIGRLVLADDDLVEVTNLHRQILFSDGDVGTDKLDAALRALRPLAKNHTAFELVRSRLLPDNARALVRSVDVVLEGADNFATKFLAADAAWLESRPIVHASAVRFVGTAWAVSRRGAPCYRCLFEDLPAGDAAPNCAEAGVMGPVVGLVGALAADLALRVLASDETAFAAVHTVDGLRDSLRPVAVRARPGCPLCGESPTISDIDETRYTPQDCAA